MATQVQTGANEHNTSSLKGATSSEVTAMRCPDPSAHQSKETTLQDHASAAALYSTGAKSSAPRKPTAQGVNPLGPDGKLSSASEYPHLSLTRPQDSSRPLVPDTITKAPPPLSNTRTHTIFPASLLSVSIPDRPPTPLRISPIPTSRVPSIRR